MCRQRQTLGTALSLKAPFDLEGQPIINDTRHVSYTINTEVSLSQARFQRRRNLLSRTHIHVPSNYSPHASCHRIFPTMSVWPTHHKPKRVSRPAQPLRFGTTWIGAAVIWVLALRRIAPTPALSTIPYSRLSMRARKRLPLSSRSRLTDKLLRARRALLGTRTLPSCAPSILVEVVHEGRRLVSLPSAPHDEDRWLSAELSSKTLYTPGFLFRVQGIGSTSLSASSSPCASSKHIFGSAASLPRHTLHIRTV
ncbi:hypothetical protein C8Q74DRAFT_100431 [Fomes fomentarius]|nr:hypothetical protein C8Q74DRAFT_100431 [Fomes fomentarius]